MTATLEIGLMPQDLDRQKIRSRRNELGLSQTEAAQRAGIPGGASAWSDIENGRHKNVGVQTVAKIATALEIDARELITPPEEKTKRRRPRPE